MERPCLKVMFTFLLLASLVVVCSDAGNAARLPPKKEWKSAHFLTAVNHASHSHCVAQQMTKTSGHATQDTFNVFPPPGEKLDHRRRRGRFLPPAGGETKWDSQGEWAFGFRRRLKKSPL